MKKKIKTAMDDLEMAFEMDAVNYSQFLNLETGGIAIFSELGDSFDEDGNAIEDPDIYDDSEKYIVIPGSDSSEAYRDMERFIETGVKDQRLRGDLLGALNKRRPFRRFRDILMNYPKVDARWFSFQEERTKNRIREWLEENNLELE
ncbi:MAG: hypothetical protein GY950_00295 [bacterium]|nr:hypothetical protein [bacterium]